MHLHPYSGKRMEGWLGVLLTLVPFVFFSACRAADVPLPQSIGSLRLEKVQLGEEARREIDRLHGKQIDFRRGYIGIYVAENSRGQLWVSEHGSESGAAKAVENMDRSMKQGKQESFWHFRKIMIEQWPVYVAVGMDQVHYFFQKGVRVIWLAVDPPLAKEAIRDALKKI